MTIRAKIDYAHRIFGRRGGLRECWHEKLRKEIMPHIVGLYILNFTSATGQVVK